MRNLIIFTVAILGPGFSTGSAQAQGCPYERMVNSWYNDYLGRQPDPGGLVGWADNLRRMPVLHAKALFLGCHEYYHRNGCTNRGFLTGLYRDFLGRVPCERELFEWERRLCRCGDRAHFLEEQWFPYVLSQQARAVAPPVVTAPPVVAPPVIEPSQVIPPTINTVPGHSHSRSEPFGDAGYGARRSGYERNARSSRYGSGRDYSRGRSVAVQQPVTPVQPIRVPGYRRAPKSGVRIQFTLGR